MAAMCIIKSGLNAFIVSSTSSLFKTFKILKSQFFGATLG